MNPFDILYGIPKKKKYAQEEVEKNLNISMLIKYLSNDKVGLSIAEYLNQHYNMKIYDMYLFAFYLPHDITYIKYNKREKVVKSEDYEYIMEYYNCNYTVAGEYYRQMSDKEFKRIKSLVRFMRGEKAKNGAY